MKEVEQIMTSLREKNKKTRIERLEKLEKERELRQLKKLLLITAIGAVILIVILVFFNRYSIVKKERECLENGLEMKAFYDREDVHYVCR